MGTITRKFANNFLSGGTFAAAAINNSSLTNITDVPTAVKGKLTLISTQTASASASISFTSGIDSTYDEYIFKFINCHPQTDDVAFGFQANASGQTGFNETITSTSFYAHNTEADTSTGLSYFTNYDQAQGTGYHWTSVHVGGQADEQCSGTVHLFNPSSTTYVKNFICSSPTYDADNGSYNYYTSGYFNTTSALTEIDFKFSSGNIDDGIIKMYGVSKT